ncbi:MAG: ABC transporter permease subunit [Pseudomonadota bacterium]
MLEWLSVNRSIVAAILIITFVATFIFSIINGRKQDKLRDSEAVFGDPDRTKGGWNWSLCGISALMLIWFYYSWGVARAFYPESATQICQVAKFDNALTPIKAALPFESRYFKSTVLIQRNTEQLKILEQNLDRQRFTSNQQAQIDMMFDDIYLLLTLSADPNEQSQQSKDMFNELSIKISQIVEKLEKGPQDKHIILGENSNAKAAIGWGISHLEIPLDPISPLGWFFDDITQDAENLSEYFLSIQNIGEQSERLIANLRQTIMQFKQDNKDFKASSDVDQEDLKYRSDFVKFFERIFRRLDDGNIFPAVMLDQLYQDMLVLDQAKKSAKGGLSTIESFLLPGGNIIKSRTQCSETGTGRWLPKPTDVVATLVRLANPDLDSGGGFKGTTLLWWKWLPIADVVDFIAPDWIADIIPGEYATHNQTGEVVPQFKDKVLTFVQGDVNMGSIPVLDGHIWHSLFRVLVALALGILLGVPLGIYMGISRFFKSFFDPLIELYRPVPPLAWAPLILTIFGIQDDGKIFLLFMVAFAIMVISARTGASGTQLSKIRASHSLGASNNQILWNVILPNAMPEILTGVRIAVGVCWGTLVAAEMLAGTTGIGFIENVARTVSDYELICGTILLMGLLGLFFDLIMRWLIARLIPWRGKG